MRRTGRSCSPRAAGATVALAVLTAAVLLGAPGCGWFRWRDVARMHTDLLERMGTDAADAYSAPRGSLEPADIVRLRYPLERAREFSASSRRRFGTTPWLDRFDELLGAYAELTDWLDRARTQPIGDAERARAGALAQRMQGAAAAVRSALAQAGP